MQTLTELFDMNKLELENYPCPGKESVLHQFILWRCMAWFSPLSFTCVNLPQLHCNLMLLGVSNQVFQCWHLWI